MLLEFGEFGNDLVLDAIGNSNTEIAQREYSTNSITHTHTHTHTALNELTVCVCVCAGGVGNNGQTSLVVQIE